MITSKQLLFFLLLAGCVAVPAKASDHASYVGRIVCHQSITPVCHVNPIIPAATLSCAVSGWRYSFDGTTKDGKNLLALLMAAQLSKQIVIFGGGGVCTKVAASEDLQYVILTGDY